MDSTAIAASFAIENWAAAGFWDDLIAGFKGCNERRVAGGEKKMPISFWTFHSALEQQHADHTIDELQECFDEGRITDEEAFMSTLTEMLDAVQVFWEGLDKRKGATPLPSEPSSPKDRIVPEAFLNQGTTDF